ncbi:MAG: hypothetical protein DSY87_07820 [Methylococcus sp.]|nr:MAG: hypothetical protein DSY87_07820 [Methylococcus sp.]
MADPKQKDNNDHPENSQQLVGFMSTAGWDGLLAQVNAQLEEMEQLPLPEVKDKVFELLAGIDAIHREALRRLVSVFKEGVLEKVVTDPAIHTLMELYDLLPPEVEAKPVAANKKNTFMGIPIQVVSTPAPEQAPVRQRYPHWVPALTAGHDLAPGCVTEVNVDNYRILICRVEDEFFAVASRCAQDGASLALASLSRYVLNCHQHNGCYYDVRQGTRIAGKGEIDCYPVRHEDDGRVMVGIDMDFTPNLPAF